MNKNIYSTSTDSQLHSTTNTHSLFEQTLQLEHSRPLVEAKGQRVTCVHERHGDDSVGSSL